MTGSLVSSHKNLELLLCKTSKLLIKAMVHGLTQWKAVIRDISREKTWEEFFSRGSRLQTVSCFVANFDKVSSWFRCN